jgi:hypothetical protein
MKQNFLKRTLLSAMAVALAMVAQAQVVEVYIFDNDGPFTNVRNSPGNGKVVAKIPVDASASFSVMAPSNGWWCIKGDSYEMLSDDPDSDWKKVRLTGSTTGYWVHNSVIAVETRNYGNQKLPLLKEPKKNSKTNCTLTGEQLVRPIDVRGDWVKVKTLDGKCSGWVDGVWLCGNPVTTCP